MKHIKLKEYIRREITSILSESKLNETLEEKVWAKLDRLRDAIGDDDYIIQSLIRAMSTDDANLYLDAMIRDHIDIVADAENYDNVSESNTPLNEGTWSLGTVMQVQNFIRDMEKIKNHYYDIVGDDQVFNGLDNAIERAKELEMEAPENRSDITEDEEPTSADLKKKDSVTTTSNKLQKLVKQMKEKAKEFKTAEGDKKDKLKDELKKMTKEKKELEKSIG